MSDEKVSHHFSRSEFACRCGCGFDDFHPALLYLLEAVREHFGKPVVINSACRCPAHNRAVGGAENSRHLHGEAADITVSKISPALVADYCEVLVGERGGLGRYSSFTHVDVRGYRTRWSA